jgi:hypothetical protein
MKTPASLGLIPLAALCIMMAGGCRRKNVDDPVKIAAMEGAIIEATQNNPSHSAKWDALIRDLTYRYMAGAGKYSPDPALPTLAKQAIDQGCVDPFVRYLWFWHLVGTTSAPNVELSREGVAIVDEMHNQQYPAFNQAFAAMRAIEMFRRDTLWTETTQASKDEYQRLFSLFHHAVMDALVNPQVLTERQARGIAGAFETFWEDPRYSRDNIYSQVDKVLLDLYGNCATLHMLRGNQAILRAWDARGWGYASTVTEEGGKVFGEQLEIAEGELKRAWKKDPTEPMIAEKMITVCMGLNRPREEMEEWFQKGQSTHGNYSSLCTAKALYLDERWSGSFEDRLAFAKECLGHPEYGSEAALILWKTHLDHRWVQGLPKTYYAKPEVWADIKQSFDAYFEREPDMVSMRVFYAYYAWMANDWHTLAQQLALTDPAITDLRELVDAPNNTADEGVAMDMGKQALLEKKQEDAGRALYDRMVAESRAHRNGT